MAETRVTTYNVQQIIGSPSQKKRAAETLTYLSGRADEIFMLQEAFQPQFLKKLKKDALSEKYHVIEPKGAWILNSGVCLLLKKEDFDLEKVIKKTYSLATSVDRLVPKGFTHIKATRKSKQEGKREKVHIIGTHTQAQYSGAEYQVIVTLTQLAQLGDYISALPKDEKVILAGDLNIALTEPGKDIESIEFKLVKYLLPLNYHRTQPEEYSYDKNNNSLARDPSATLDYIFSNGYEEGAAEILSDAKYKNESTQDIFDHYSIQDISDHYPVSATLTSSDSIEPAENLTVEEQEQELILSKLLRFAYKNAACKTMGIWQTAHAKAIYFATCDLVEHIHRLRKEGKTLAAGNRFLDYCLRYKRSSEEESSTHSNRFFKTSAKIIPQSLESILATTNPEEYVTWLTQQKQLSSTFKSKNLLVQAIETKITTLTKSIQNSFFSYLNVRRVMKINALKLALDHLKNPREESKELLNTITREYPNYADAVSRSEVKDLIDCVIERLNEIQGMKPIQDWAYAKNRLLV